MILLQFNWNFDLGVVVGLIGIGLSLVALIISWRLFNQQRVINNYIIENEKKKREEEKHAKIRITSLEKAVPNNYMIVKIENYGECEATEIEVTILSESSYYHGFAQDLPKALKPTENREIGFHWSDNQYSIKYEVKWEDKAGKHSEESEFRNTSKR